MIYQLFYGTDLYHIGRQMHIYRRASGVHHYVAGLKVAPLFQYADLVHDDIIQALFFTIIKCPNAPTKAQLID